MKKKYITKEKINKIIKGKIEKYNLIKSLRICLNFIYTIGIILAIIILIIDIKEKNYKDRSTREIVWMILFYIIIFSGFFLSYVCIRCNKKLIL